jgi:hypothetical protein
VPITARAGSLSLLTCSVVLALTAGTLALVTEAAATTAAAARHRVTVEATTPAASVLGRSGPAAASTPVPPVSGATPAPTPSVAASSSAPTVPTAAATSAGSRAGSSSRSTASSAPSSGPSTPVQPASAAVAPSGTGAATALAGEVVTWQTEQRPSVGGVVQADRIQQVAAPGPAAGRPAGQVKRFELRPGDLQGSSGYLANRAEVYGRHAQPRTTPAAHWPDPIGSVRWYSFDLYLPADFATATDTKWLTITQWKGLQGGSPPIAVEIKRDQLRLGGARANAGKIPGDGLLGQVNRGTWTHLVVGLYHSPDPAAGWVEVWRDGRQALPRTAVATMDTIGGQPDPIYLKQGLYRSSSWTVPHVLYFSPVTIGARRSDVP